MNWLPGFLSPVAAWLLALIIPLVILYFLKLKRPRQQVSSLVLWRQVLNDNRVNSPFQKFKRNLLLLLQLLILLLLIFAAMQPIIRGNMSESARLPLLIDHSASMRATGPTDDKTRLDLAKEKVLAMIDGLPDDQHMCIISFANSARKLCDFTNNKRVLRAALDSIQIHDVPSNITEAMRLTEAIAQTEPFHRALLISDGNFPAQTDFALPFMVDYDLLPQAGANYGITAFNARRAGPDVWSVFALIEGSDVAEGQRARAVTGQLTLLQDGKSVGDAISFVLGEGQSQRIEFTVSAAAATRLELRMSIDGRDSLATDNLAYLDLEPARRLWVYVPPHFTELRNAYKDNPDIRLMPDGGPTDTAAVYDLVISDRKGDMELTAPMRLFVGFVPEAVEDMVNVDQTVTTDVIEWRREDNVLRYANLNYVLVGRNITVNEGVGPADFDRAGYDIIMYGQNGPLMLKQRASSGELTYHMLFHPENESSLRYRTAYPILAVNLLDSAMHLAKLAETPGMTTGVLPPLQLEALKTYTVKGPDHRTLSYESDDRGQLSGVSAPRVGRYEISDGGLVSSKKVAEVGVNLLHRGETALAAVREITFEEQTVAADMEGLQADKAHWRTLLLIALVILAIEWWYFNRKVGGFGR